MALLSGGGYAQLAAVPAGQLMPFPPDLDWAEAAAIPEVVRARKSVRETCFQIRRWFERDIGGPRANDGIEAARIRWAVPHQASARLLKLCAQAKNKSRPSMISTCIVTMKSVLTSRSMATNTTRGAVAISRPD